MFSKSQQGFTLVTAIFSLVVLAGLGAFMTTISLNQQIGSTLDFIGAKAHKAARSGTEWGSCQTLIMLNADSLCWQIQHSNRLKSLVYVTGFRDSYRVLINKDYFIRSTDQTLLMVGKPDPQA